MKEIERQLRKLQVFHQDVTFAASKAGCPPDMAVADWIERLGRGRDIVLGCCRRLTERAKEIKAQGDSLQGLTPEQMIEPENLKRGGTFGAEALRLVDMLAHGFLPLDPADQEDLEQALRDLADDMKRAKAVKKSLENRRR